jgi:hypothetical protein
MARIPVAYIDSPMRYFVFNNDGCTLLPLESETLPLPKGALCLVDSNTNLIKPPDGFFHPSYSSYIVQASSPRPDRWKRWSKQHGSHKWIMSFWERDEMVTLE